LGTGGLQHRADVRDHSPEPLPGPVPTAFATTAAAHDVHIRRPRPRRAVPPIAGSL